MKQLGLIACLLIFMIGLTVSSFAKPRIYKWVKDKQVSSDQTLSRSQSSRVVPVKESDALNIVKLVMTEDLYMALAKYHKSKHRQDAESTPDTVLPEEIIRLREVELIDEDYRYILEVSLKKYGNRTRVVAKARPIYKIRDLDAEAAQDDDSSGGNSVEVRIDAAEGSGGVAVGPIIVAPVVGLPSDYGINPLPDAAKRGGELVRSFMYFLDKRIASVKNSNVTSVNQRENVGADVSVQDQQAGLDNSSGTKVEIKVKTPY